MQLCVSVLASMHSEHKSRCLHQCGMLPADVVTTAACVMLGVGSCVSDARSANKTGPGFK